MQLTSLTGRSSADGPLACIRKRAEHLGTVEAASEKEAIEKAAKQFDIPPERKNRIAVEKMS